MFGIRSSCLTCALAFLLASPLLFAWQDEKSPRGRTPDRRDLGDVRGTLRAIDTGKHSLTLALTGRGRESAEEKNYTIAKDVEVLVDEGRGRRFAFLEGKLSDLAPGALLTLQISGDGKTVESIVAEGPTVQGQIKAVDTSKNTITLATQRGRGEEAEEKTYSLSKQAEIVLDDGRGRRLSLKEGKLGDLAAGGLVTLKLGVDQKLVESVVAEGPLVSGILKSVDSGAHTLSLQLRPNRGEEAPEKSYTLASNAEVLLEAGKGPRFYARMGKISDLQAGQMLQLKLSADQKQVVMVRAEGPTVFGRLESVDPGKNTLTLLVGAGRGSDGEKKTYTVTRGATVFADGKEIKLADLKVEDNTFVVIKLGLDQKTVQRINLAGRR